MGQACRRGAFVIAVALGVSACCHTIGTIHTPTRVNLPNRPESLRFAVIGDSGELGDAQTAIAGLLTKYRALFPYEFVLMVGDNTYDPSKTMAREFEEPFKALLDQKVAFYAVLGNHDLNGDVQMRYPLFHMGGEDHYSFRKQNVDFFALNSNKPDRAQLRWIDQTLPGANAGWKIAFFHHPLYSSGFHAQPLTGGQEQKSLRALWEPRFCQYGVDVIFSGHEHYYERIKPRHGVQHFVTGAASKLRCNDVSKRRTNDFTAQFNDVDFSFMLIEISKEQLFFQTITLTGEKVDEGILRKSSVDQRKCDPIAK
jgi:3',5'-cyclic AMP phosphodiesterase CpdA